MPQPNYGYLDPYSSEAAEIERRRRYADALREQSGAPLQPYSVGGMQAPISWTQGAAKLLQGYNAGAAGRDADERARVLRGKVQSDALRWYGEQPQAGVPRAMPTDQEGTGSFDMSGSAGPEQTSAAPSKNEMMAWLLRGQGNPMSAPMAQAMMAQQMKGPKWEKADIRQTDGTVKKGYVDMNSPNPEATFRPLGTEPVKQEFVSNQPVNPYTQSGPIQDPNALMIPDGKGGFKPNEPLVGIKKDIAAKGATNVSVDARVGQKYGEQFAGQIAKADSDMRDAAIKAPELAERSNRIKETLASGKITTGFGADYRLAFGKALGLAGASDAETLKNTETLVAELASNTMDAIKASGMGGGTGFSNADRDFLEKAKGGKITLEASTINRLADLSHKAAALSADRWNKRVKQIPKSALEGTGITQEDVKVPGLFAGGKPPMYAVNPQTKERIMSTDGGNTWRPAQ